MTHAAGYPLDMEPIPASWTRPISRAEYHRMAEAGFFEDERVELLYGRIVPMTSMGNPHCIAVEVINRVFVLALHDRARIRPALPFAADDWSEPEPDLGVYPMTYSGDHPDRAHLIIEVSDSSLAKDEGPKLRLYAEVGVPEYWIIDLPHRVIRVFRTPRDGRWTVTFEVGPGESASPLAFPEVALAADEVLAGTPG